MDMIFIAGEFLGDCLPKDRQYLYHYFKTDIQRNFIRYMYAFDNSKYFAEHTGVPCTKRNLQLLTDKLNMLEEEHRSAKFKMDLDLLERIEKGKFKLKG